MSSTGEIAARRAARATKRIRPPTFDDVGGAQLRVVGEAVGDDRLRDRRRDRAHVGVVDAQHGDAVERQPLREVDEGALQPREVVAVGLHVVGVDVGDHREHRRQVQERCVGLVGLGDQEVALAEARVGVGRQQPAADHERRIEPAFGEHRCDEARRRRLAVRAGDGDALLQAHQLGQHQRARHDRDAALARGRDLGVVRRDRGRHDDRVGAGDVARRRGRSRSRRRARRGAA